MANIYWLYHSHRLENLWSLFSLVHFDYFFVFRPFYGNLTCGLILEILKLYSHWTSGENLGNPNQDFSYHSSSQWSFWVLLITVDHFFDLYYQDSSVQSFGDLSSSWCYFFPSYLFKLHEDPEDVCIWDFTPGFVVNVLWQMSHELACTY